MLLWSGMNFSGTTSGQGSRRRDLAEINVTGLVDIIFILLIFFVLTTSFSQSAGVQIELPSAQAADQQFSSDDFIVTLTADGQLLVQGEALDLGALRSRLERFVATKPKGALIVQADAEVAHRRVVEVIDAAKAVGLKSLGIATQ